MSTWSKQYLAGLFDGEGHVSVGFSTKRQPYLFLTISIELKYAYRIQRHMRKQGIAGYISYNRNHWGRSGRLQFHGVNCEKVLDMIQPYVVLKKRQVIIMKRALRIRRKYHFKRGSSTRYAELNRCRYQLHALAKKGIKTLREY